MTAASPAILPSVTITRREFLKGSAGLAVAVSGAAGCAAAVSKRGLPRSEDVSAPFLHGVASGDPLADRVVLWTRVTPPSGHAGAIDVRFEVARDPDMRTVVTEGRFATRPEVDWVAKHPSRQDCVVLSPA